MSIDRQFQQFGRKATESVTAPEPKKVCNVCEALQKRVIAQQADIKALKGALANAELALEAETKLRERETKIPETETKSLHSVSPETKLEVNKVSAILAAVNAAEPQLEALKRVLKKRGRPPGAKPWEAEGISKAAWYRKNKP